MSNFLQKLPDELMGEILSLFSLENRFLRFARLDKRSNFLAYTLPGLQLLLFNNTSFKIVDKMDQLGYETESELERFEELGVYPENWMLEWMRADMAS